MLIGGAGQQLLRDRAGGGVRNEQIDRHLIFF